MIEPKKDPDIWDPPTPSVNLKKNLPQNKWIAKKKLNLEKPKHQ